MSVRFVHAADIHLGSPLRTVGADSPALQEQLADATYTAFERIIDVAIEEAVDFLIVAGDLYDQDSRSVRANEFVVTQFERLADAEIPAYVCYGNHDPVEAATEYFTLPDTVHEFSAADAEEVIYPEGGTPKARIWGQSYRSRSDDRKMPYHYRPADASVPNIGVLHTGLDPDSQKYVPCSTSDLTEREDIHYWALGHIHNPDVRNEQPPIVYPGIPQGRQITETGVGGCLLVELGTTTEPNLEFIPTSPIVWHRVDVPVDGADDGDDIETVNDLEDRVLDALYSLDYDATTDLPDHSFDVRTDDWEPTGHVCRWELTGRSPIRDVIADDEEVLEVVRERVREEATHRTPFVWTEGVRDWTRRPLPDVDDIWAEDQVFEQLEQVLTAARTDDDLRARLRRRAGDIWYEPDDTEEERPAELALTDEKFEELIDRAEALAVDELLDRRFS